MIKLLDVPIFLTVLSVIILISINIYTKNNDKLYVLIKNETTEWIYPLDINRTVHIEGELGTVTILIENKSAAFIESNCPQKICINAGKLKKAGDWAACLPNRVIVEITTKQNGSTRDE